MFVHVQDEAVVVVVFAGGAGSVTESHETVVGVHSPSLPHLTCHQLHKETRLILKISKVDKIVV